MQNKKLSNKIMECRIWNRPHSIFHIPHSKFYLKAFSLLELIIYIAILSGLMVITANSFISLSKGQGQSQARADVNSAIRFSTELFRQDIKNATIVTTPIMGTASTTLNLTVGGTVIIYDILAGQLRRKEGAAAPTAVTSGNIAVTSLLFTRQENYNSVTLATTTAVQILMTLRYNASSTDWMYSDTLRTTVSLR
ncbi:MAG: hypothetical protein NTW35_00915 [Candidatus Nomurabacteria bacterium]|nr:hypothetical protein [Candidatus Nomurabacteria bacterium]